MSSQHGNLLLIALHFRLSSWHFNSNHGLISCFSPAKFVFFTSLISYQEKSICVKSAYCFTIWIEHIIYRSSTATDLYCFFTLFPFALCDISFKHSFINQFDLSVRYAALLTQLIKACHQHYHSDLHNCRQKVDDHQPSQSLCYIDHAPYFLDIHAHPKYALFRVSQSYIK